MNYKNVHLLFRLFYCFFLRTVLNIGLLKSKLFRGIVTVLFLGLYSYMTAMISLFFLHVNSTYAQTSVVLDTYCCSIILITLVIFLFIKVTFLKKGVFLTMTMQLPISRSELNLSILIFETTIALGMTFALSSMMAIAMTISNGIIMLPRIICNIVYLSVTVFLVLEVAYMLISRIVNFFQLEKIRNIILLSLLAALFICLYTSILPNVLQEILFNYQDGGETLIFVFYAYWYEKIGFVFTTILFLLVVLGLLFIALKFQDNSIANTNNYVGIPSPGHTVSLLKAYVLSFVRNADSICYYVIAVIVFFLLEASDSQYGIFSMLLVTISGVYAYSYTDTIRLLYIQKEYSVFKDYLFLIEAQMIQCLIASLPFMLIDLVIRHNFLMTGLYVLSAISATILFTSVGILFPAKQENPFSVIAGTIFVFVISVAFGILCLFLNSRIAGILIFFLLLVGAVSVSIVGMRRLYLRKRYL